jgi:uncharacterized membrane protein YphA (DoxX/SURF4 family)
MERARHYSNRVSSFPDPLHMGHRYSLLLAVAAELVGGILITIGLAGRVAALLLAFSLGMAVFTGEAGASWRQREVATLYLAATLAILKFHCRTACSVLAALCLPALAGCGSGSTGRRRGVLGLGS